MELCVQRQVSSSSSPQVAVAVAERPEFPLYRCHGLSLLGRVPICKATCRAHLTHQELKLAMALRLHHRGPNSLNRLEPKPNTSMLLRSALPRDPRHTARRSACEVCAAFAAFFRAYLCTPFNHAYIPPASADGHLNAYYSSVNQSRLSLLAPHGLLTGQEGTSRSGSANKMQAVSRGRGGMLELHQRTSASVGRHAPSSITTSTRPHVRALGINIGDSLRISARWWCLRR